MDESSLKRTAGATIDEIGAALHADYLVRVERALGARFASGRDRLSACPGVASELALETCRSLCGDADPAFSAAASIHAAFIAIALIDDLLDEDPRDELSVGRTANLASVAQALAFEFLAELQSPAHAATAGRLARMLVDTAWGQERDVTESDDAVDTWSLAAAKTSPLFEGALYCGAIAGGAPQQLATDVERLGAFIGRIVQVQDDLTDVLEPGSDADWRRPSSNLVLRFALQVDHADRSRVKELLVTAGVEGDSRVEIRRILGTCGAIEYGMSSVLFYAGDARRYLERQPIDTTHLAEFLDRLTAPTENLLASLGVGVGDLSQHLAAVFGP